MILSLLLTLSAIAAGPGGTVANGGTSFACHDDIPGNTEFRELNVADYLIALGEGAQPEDFAQPNSWAEDQARIARAIQGSMLAATFEDFAASTKQIQHSPEAHVLKRSWQRTSYVGHFAVSVKPQFKIPLRCDFGESSHGGFQAIVYWRTVTRVQVFDRVVYHYDPIYLDLLAKTSHLQLSLMLTHEWLWDHTDDPAVNRAANMFLHSRELDHLTPEEIQARLHQLGLRF